MKKGVYVASTRGMTAGVYIASVIRMEGLVSFARTLFMRTGFYIARVI
jgi:hypothetical protein